MREHVRASAHREWTDTLAAEQRKVIDDSLWDVYYKEQQLPEVMTKQAPNAVHWAMNSPRANLESILNVVDRLGLVVLPVEYINPKAWAAEGYEMKQAIGLFSELAGSTAQMADGVKKTPRRQDVYVVAPPSYYDISRHISAENPNLQIYAGKNEQAFLAMTMMVPTLRVMRSNIDMLNANQKSMDSRLSRVEDRSDQMSAMLKAQQDQLNRLRTETEAQLERLQKQVDGEVKRETERALRHYAEAGVSNDPEARRIFETLKSSDSSLVDLRQAADALASVSFRILDPMMFALNPNVSLDSRQGSALIGPCWGPDFADIIIEALGLGKTKLKANASHFVTKLKGAGVPYRDQRLLAPNELLTESLMEKLSYTISQPRAKQAADWAISTELGRRLWGMGTSDARVNKAFTLLALLHVPLTHSKAPIAVKNTKDNKNDSPSEATDDSLIEVPFNFNYANNKLELVVKDYSGYKMVAGMAKERLDNLGEALKAVAATYKTKR